MASLTRIEPRRVRRFRRLFWAAAFVALAFHALALWLVVLPPPRSEIPRSAIFVYPEPVLIESPTERRLELAEALEAGELPLPAAERARARREAAPVVPIISVPTLAAGAPEAQTIPATALTRLKEAVLPLEATPFGVRRRGVERDEARLAIMRAESLVNARLATLVETSPSVSAGPLSLANGGVTFPIPWGGFVRADRVDETWREERCRGKDDRKADKPGEAEARRAQCS